MTSNQFRDALAYLNLTQGALANTLEINIRSANAYACGRKIPKLVAMAVELLTIKQEQKQ